MRNDWPIVAAAWLITLLAATLLAAGPIYSDAVSLAGLRRVLLDAPVTEANVEATALVNPGEVEFTSAEVERQIRGAVGGVGVDIERSARSDTYALPAQPDERVRDLAVLGFAGGLPEHAELVEGAWPETRGSGPVPVAVSVPIADELGWSLGDRSVLTNRRDEASTVEVELVGVFAIQDASDPFWWEDAQVTEGWTESSSYRTFGPLFTTADELLGRVIRNEVRVTWHAFPHFETIQLEQVAGLRAGASQLPARLGFALAEAFPSAGTSLHQILAEAQRSLLVTRTGVLLLIVQLGILAAYAIVLTAGLLAEHRRADTALLRSRGAGPLQVAALALAEALVLAVPAAVAAPFLAAAALGAFNVAGPLASAGVAIVPQLSVTAFVVAGAAALGAALLLVVPAFLAARSFVDEEGRRSRFETRTIGQRLGLDIALLAVTLIGFWQLRLYGAPLTESVQGSLGLDPLLVAAPAIGLLAGGVLALRIVPLLASAAETLTRRGRRLVGALGAQQVARRPLRYTRSALLLMLAVSMGVFAISYADTWHSSQEDQAAYQVGADVRIVSLGGGGTVPPWSLEAALRRIQGVVEPMPLNRQFLRLPTGSRQGQLVALDADSAARVVVLRDDLSATPFAELAGRLSEERPDPALTRIETAPRRLEVRVRMAVGEVGVFVYDDEREDWVIEKRPIAEVPSVAVGAELVVRDAKGIVERFSAPSQPWSADGQALVVDLAPVTPRTVAAVEEIGGGLTAPIEVLAVDVTVHLPSLSVVDEGRVELLGMAASSAAEGDDWAAVDLGDAAGWEALLLRNDPVSSAPMVGRLQDLALVLDGDPIGGQLLGPSQPGVRPLAVSYVRGGLLALADAPLPVVVNRAFLGATASDLGDEVTSRVGGLLRTLRVVGVVESFPTTDATQPQAIADLATVGLLAFASSQSTVTPLEWWIATEPGAGQQVEDALRNGPYVRGEIASLEGRARTLSADPVALGIIGALSLGFVVAGLFAVIGLTVSAAVSARQRRTEFALLRALGLSAGQLSGWLWLENAGVVVVSLAAGTGLGLLIGWVVLPFVTVTQEAAAPFPPPLVQTPWLSIGLLVVVSTLALGVTVVVLAAVLRRIGIGSVLRMGED
ncbi:MAG TPA: FtsX-like permease family protein [Candidatus Limnocylindria bacterium]